MVSERSLTGRSTLNKVAVLKWVFCGVAVGLLVAGTIWGNAHNIYTR
jgi:hypothetical protein